MRKMDQAEVESRLGELPGWNVQDGALVREFRFRDFVEAFAFMTKVALLAESRNHHPEWSNVYNRVTVGLSTHDAGGITELDFELAEAVSAVS